MRSVFVASAFLLLVACSRAGGGADILKDTGTGGVGGGATGGTNAGVAGAAGEDGELPPPEEEDPAGAGGTSSGKGGTGSGTAAGSAGSPTAGGKGGTGGKGGSAGSPDGSGADCNAEDGWPEQARKLECDVLAMVNEQRAAGATCGGIAMAPVPALTMHPLLRKAAREHAKDMADKNYFDHASPDGSSSGDRMKAAGYDGTYYGENIAHGQDDPAAVMKSWMGSSGHCKGIMAGKYHHLGMGFAATTTGDTYWVQDFGAP